MQVLDWRPAAVAALKDTYRPTGRGREGVGCLYLQLIAN